MLISELASELFKEYARKENSKASWYYLSSERKLEWMKETVTLCERILTKVENDIKPIGPSSKLDTNYAIGYRDAQIIERESFKKLLKDTKDRLNKELEVFIK